MAKLKNENLKTQWCKGCGYCIETCPKGAISMSEHVNLAGYRYIQLDESKCINCGQCRIVCPDCVFRFTSEEGEKA